MKKKEIKTSSNEKQETPSSLKNDIHKKNGVKKGYNENNPTQPQGAFKPDAMNKKR